MARLEQLSLPLIEHFKTVRLRALEDTPTAFASTYAKESAFSDDDWRKRAATWNGPRSVCYLGMDEGGPCGMIAGYFDEYIPQRAWVASMWVAPTHRRTGLGTMLMDAVRVWANSLGAAELRLLVTSNNSAAMRFYERCGYTFTGTTGPYQNDPALYEYEMMLHLHNG